MIRLPHDLEAIDRELDLLGRPRADIAELVARYAGRARSDAMFDGLRRSTPSPAASAQGAGRDDAAAPQSVPPEEERPLKAWAKEEGVEAASVMDLSEDHDEFELLVEDEELVEDDQFEPV